MAPRAARRCIFSRRYQKHNYVCCLNAASFLAAPGSFQLASPPQRARRRDEELQAACCLRAGGSARQGLKAPPPPLGR